jgi:hypothetical protein
VRTSGLLVRFLAVAACVPAAGLALRAQRGGGAPASPPPVPVTASSLAAHPASYVGRTVTVMGTVAEQLSPTVFTVTQGTATTMPLAILVVAPTLTAAPPADAYVSVIGAAMLFDPADVKMPQGDALDIPAAVAAKYRGHPAVLATSVLTADLTDLAKKKPAPMSPEEQAFSNLMKQVNPAATALRTSVAASDGTTTHDRAAELKTLFAGVQAFFEKRGIADARGWAGEAMKLSETIETAAGASKWPEATEAAAGLTRLCTTCHTAYRERLEDGTYRLKSTR